MFYSHLKGHIEALLFAYGDPISADKLAEMLELDRQNVIDLIEELKQDMSSNQRGLKILEVAGGYQLCTKPECAGTLDKLIQIQEAKLSMAAMETLSIVAFKSRRSGEYPAGTGVD
ncbi:MAG: chromosome segregation and condensation protein, ScpB [Firmicutes bacterium]|nr:chromosome segregation and condensation protein, ScpB [Bacillota bacterium]